MSQRFRAYRKDSKFGLAIITGGSSGIGKSIIERLETLDPDMPIINLSRRIPASFYNGSNRVHLECDLSDRASRDAAFTTVEHELDQSTEPGPILLVNNAGFGAYRVVAEQEVQSQSDMIEVNISALVELTTRLLPKIKQRGGSIMNIASIAAFQPTPYLASYGASKAFVLNWTLALNEELRGTSVRAIAVCPGPTATAFFKNAGIDTDKRAVSPEHVVDAAFRALAKGKALVVVGALNAFAMAALRLLPPVLQARVSGMFLRRNRSTTKSSS